MDIPKKELLSFNLFYLVEFFNITLGEIKGKIADSNYKLLYNLSTYLTKETAMFEGLEKLASYQSTNDLAIFLFDMMEKTEDVGPDYIYKSLPDLAEDFQNLYSLMIEDEDSVNALNEMVGTFREKIGDEQKEKQLEEFVEMVKTEKILETISFEEFYIKELINHAAATVREKDFDDEIINFCSQFIDIAEAASSESGLYSDALTSLLLKAKLSLPGKDVLYSDLYKNLSNNVNDFVKEIFEFKNSSPNEFKDILQTGRIKQAESVEKNEEKTSKDQPQLNSLLVEYFKSEIEDYFSEINGLLNLQEKDRNKEKTLIEIVKKLKGLKEVCMIHGYSGLEYVANLLTIEFTELQKSNLKITQPSIDLVESILNDLKIVENFTDKAHGQIHVDKIKLKITALRETFSADYEVVEENVLEQEAQPSNEIIEEEIEEQETQPLNDIFEDDDEAVPIEEPVLIGLQDREKFLSIVQTLFEKFSTHVLIHHTTIKQLESQNIISSIINLIEINSNIFHEELLSKVVIPLKNIYTDIIDKGEISTDANDVLALVWEQLGNSTLDTINFEDLNTQILSLAVPVKEIQKDADIPETLLFENPRVFEAFLEVSEKLWHNRKSAFVKSEISVEEYQSIDYLFSIYRNNLILMEYANYIPFIDYLASCYKTSLSNPFVNEKASELEETFILFFDRLRHQGKDGNCDDIVEVLKDTLNIHENQPLEEPAEEEQTITAAKPLESAMDKIEEEQEPPVPDIVPAVEEEKDDITLFREETAAYLKTIDENLKGFAETKDRKNLNNIETACHSVRSAAHYLNLQDISKLAATIEDAAELFGQSELPMPANLATDLRIGIQTLENLISNPNTEFSATLEMMESLLDHIVIEDMGTAPEKERTSFKIDEKEIQMVSKPDIEEKPLFSADSVDDEDLQEIFREEANTFLGDIHNANLKLLDDPADEKAAKSLGYAAHSLSSAAKMLGFNEISEITEILEKVTDAVYNKNVDYSKKLYDKIEEAASVIQDITDGKGPDNKTINTLIAEIEPANWTEQVEEAEAEKLEESEIEDQVGGEEEEDDILPPNMVMVFVEEANQLIADLNRDYLELEKMPESDMLLANVLRSLHTLKGSAYISKYNLIGDIAHKLEDFFELYKEKDSNVKNEMLDSAFISLDIITDMVNSINETGSEKIDNLTTRLAEIDNKLFLFQNFNESSGPDPVDKDISKPIESSEKKIKKSDDDSFLKISTEYMDKLVDMASELMINQTQLGSHLHTLKEVLSDIEGERKQINSAENFIEDALELGILDKDYKGVGDEDKKEQVKKISENIKDMVRALNMIHSDLNSLTEGFEQNIGRISSISKLLHSDMLKTRMVPVDNLFNRYPRAVRDLAQKQKKKVNLVIEDNDTEMDRAMVEGLSEPILHIIRNAIDHGIETPEERKSNGKSETGTLLLKAHQEKNQIVINIEDDGRGLDIDAIKAKIIEKELAVKENVDKMSVAEVLDYIFYPGFSTRDKASDTSGRGIGLDAVSNQIQKLKGNIRIKTEKNVGTSFFLRVPLTLVISQALMVKVNLQAVAIPVIAVQESIQFKHSEIISDEGKQYVSVRGRLLPFMQLKDILKFNKDSEVSDKALQMAVVIFDAGVSMALGIDEVVGRQEVVIKSLGSHLQNVDYISGGTILANGDVALILDYALVIRTIEMHYFGKMSEKHPTTKTVRETQAPVKKSEKAEMPIQEKLSENLKTDEPVQVKTYDAKNIKQHSIENRKPVVIVVDDSNSVRNFVGSILERNGYIIIKSTNGADALEKMNTHDVDLVITDLEMPKMHGFDLISNIRNQKKNDELPIIILTGRAGMKHRQTGEELGANSFIVKPFKEKDLLQALEQYIKTG